MVNRRPEGIQWKETDDLFLRFHLHRQVTICSTASHFSPCLSKCHADTRDLFVKHSSDQVIFHSKIGQSSPLTLLIYFLTYPVLASITCKSLRKIKHINASRLLSWSPYGCTHVPLPHFVWRHCNGYFSVKPLLNSSGLQQILSLLWAITVLSTHNVNTALVTLSKLFRCPFLF